jgi:hypothetical protein
MIFKYLNNLLAVSLVMGGFDISDFSLYNQK